MKLKLKVLRPFKDKNNLKICYEVGGELSIPTDKPENVARINDLVARGLCEIAAAEAEVPAAAPVGKDDEAAPATVSFGGQEHPLAAMKVALEAVGVAVAKNAGVPAVTKALNALTEEQTAALVEVLAAKEE